MVTDSLGHLPYERMLETSAAHDIEGLEFNACNWTSAPCFNLGEMLKSRPVRDKLQPDLKQRNLSLVALNSHLENGSLKDIPGHAWSYITLGYGNGESIWRDFSYRLRMVGYDGWLSIEHEDVML